MEISEVVLLDCIHKLLIQATAIDATRDQVKSAADLVATALLKLLGVRNK